MSENFKQLDLSQEARALAMEISRLEEAILRGVPFDCWGITPGIESAAPRFDAWEVPPPPDSKAVARPSAS